MSNEVSIFANGSAIPAYLKSSELSPATQALMGADNRRISVKGGIFRMIVGGQEVAKNEDRAMNMVIVAASPHILRQYYAGTYVEGATAAPDCWSPDGITPDASSAKVQAPNCQNCPMNVAGSGQGTSKACRHQQRLAVVLENDIIGGDVYGLSLAATSLFGKGEVGKLPLKAYAKLLGTHGVDVTSVVTEMRFDTDSATPKLVFRAMRALEVPELKAVIEHSNSIDAKEAIKNSFNAANTTPTAVPQKELPFTLEDTKSASKVADPGEPTVREKKTTSSAKPSDLEAVLAEWGE